MKLFYCCNSLISFVILFVLISHTSFVNSVYQFSKNQAFILSQVRNHSDFLRYLVRGGLNSSSQVPKQGNFDDDLPDFVGCQVQDTIVSVPQPTSSELFHYPLCIIAKRCSGCCYTNDKACLPISTSTKTITVLVMSSDGVMYDNVGRAEVAIEEHVACDCKCRLQAHNCNDLIHIFNESTCSCDCKWTERCPIRQIWDTMTCSCVCQNMMPCSPGHIFDVESCRCEPDPTFTETDRMQYYLQAACRKTCPQSLSLRIPQDSCFCT